MNKQIRALFPFLTSSQIAHPGAARGAPVYLDSAATTQKPQAVIDAISRFYSSECATVHRGVYDRAETVTSAYEAVREKTAQFIGAADPAEIIFTSGATAGINFVVDAFARGIVQAGDEIVTTIAEHHANFLPWQRLAARAQATIRYIPIDSTSYQVDALRANNTENEVCACGPYCMRAWISAKTRFVTITYDSNVLGNIWGADYAYLRSLIYHARQQGAYVLIDAAQSIGHVPFQISPLNPDFLVFSSHKMLGPTGVGVLYMRRELHHQIEPYQLGGGMVYSAGTAESLWQASPHKFEAGTPPIASVIGLGAALDFYRMHIDLSELARYETALRTFLYHELSVIPGITIFGHEPSATQAGHLLSFSHTNVHAHDIASFLSQRAIAVRAGHHCAQPLAEALNFGASVRVSTHVYSTQDDIALFLDALREAFAALR